MEAALRGSKAQEQISLLKQLTLRNPRTLAPSRRRGASGPGNARVGN